MNQDHTGLLACFGRAHVDELDIDLPFDMVDDRHGFLLYRADFVSFPLREKRDIQTAD
jgi:hypothetical protein